MRISQLEYLKAIKNYGSISQAALELYISQSTISKAIKELEEELGVEILTRSKKGAIFTPFGEDILKSAEKIMVEIGKIKNVKYTAKDSIKGHLKLGAGSHFCASILTDIIIDIETQYKNVRFSLCREYSKDLLKEICQGKVDIALIQLNTFDMEVHYSQGSGHKL